MTATTEISTRPAPTTITVICCVCGHYLRTVDGQGVSGISHGYCGTCGDTMLAEYERERKAVAQ